MNLNLFRHHNKNKNIGVGNGITKFMNLYLAFEIVNFILLVADLTETDLMVLYISQAAIPLYYNGTMYAFLKDSFQEGVILIRKKVTLPQCFLPLAPRK